MLSLFLKGCFPALDSSFLCGGIPHVSGGSHSPVHPPLLNCSSCITPTAEKPFLSYQGGSQTPKIASAMTLSNDFETGASVRKANKS